MNIHGVPRSQAQDVYNSEYRYDNESSTDEEILDDDDESSDDDDDFKSRIGKIATKTSHQGKVRIQRTKEDNEDEEEGEKDEFEEEMKKEMEERMLQAEKDAAIANTDVPFDDDMEPEFPMEQAESSGTKDKGTIDPQDKYDDIYFDSDDEADESGKKEKRKFLTDDDLLYDPKMDDDDQTWVDDVRRSYQVQDTTKKNKSGLKPLPNSDAVLNCPACFTAVCLDCQRHEIYKTQYRAMFVINCSVITEEIMKIPLKKKGKGKKTRAITNPDDEYHPVRCDQCKTEIAMYDKDEVYHFFNVVASHT